MSPAQIRDRLDDRFRLLTGGKRSALPRHQTLQATIQWSYDLLSDEEQKFLRQLSVFTGGWTLDRALRVVGVGDQLRLLDIFERLVGKSLVFVERRPGADPRYNLLETVRQYLHERLMECGEADATRKRHLDDLLALADDAYDVRLHRGEASATLLEDEHDNLRAALAFARERDPELYLRLAGTLAWFWQARSHLIEGCEHLVAALASTSPGPVRAARARALWGAANMLTWQGDTERPLPWMHDALNIWRILGDTHEVALSLEGVGWAQFFSGDDVAACTTFEDYLALQRESGDVHLINHAMVALAQALVALGRVSEARPMARQIIAFSESHSDRRSEHFGWHFLADCDLIEGHCGESLVLYRKSLTLAQAIGDRMEVGFEVQGVAMSLAGLGDAREALFMGGAVAAEWERIGANPRIRFWDELLDRYLGGAREALTRERANREWEEGRMLPFDEAVEFAKAHEVMKADS